MIESIHRILVEIIFWELEILGFCITVKGVYKLWRWKHT